MEYKMIMSDMDGTLLEDARTLSQENITAIGQAIEKGVIFVIATGRSVMGVTPYLKKLNLEGNKGFVVCQNGGVIYNLKDMSINKKYNFTKEDFQNTNDFATALNDIELFFYDDSDLIVVKETPEVEDYCNVMGIKPIITDKPLEYPHGFTKVVIHGSHEDLLKIQENLRSNPNSGLECFFSNDRYLEFTKKGVNKGVAMEFVAEQMGYKLEEVIAIGDSENDISMISKAGLGVAMGNSMDIVKDSADVVLDKDCVNHGVADMIKRFVL